MAQTLTIGNTNQVAYLKSQSITMKRRTADFALVSPVVIPAVGNIVVMSGATGYWSGTVVSVMITDTVEKGTGILVTISATNTAPQNVTDAPFDVSDTPDYASSFPYKHLMTRTVTNIDGRTEVSGSFTIYESGLNPGHRFLLTSANHGYADEEFVVTQRTTTYPAKDDDNPEIRIEFGEEGIGVTTLPTNAPPAAPGTPAGTTLYKFFDANDGGDTLTWTGILANQAGGAEGSAYYYFKSSAPNNYCTSFAATAGTVYRFTGYTHIASGNSLKVAWRSDAAGSTGAITDTNPTVISVSTLASGVTSKWTPFSMDITAPTGTTSMSLGRGGSSCDFDRIRISTVTAGTPTATVDPYALDGTGSSPYFARSDDPRFKYLTEDWTAYTPVLTATSSNPVLGSSTLTGRYKRLNASSYLIRVSYTVTTGGSYAAGSGAYEFSLPDGVTPASATAVGSFAILDSGTRRYTGTCLVASGGTKITPCIVEYASSDRTVQHNLPVVWATGDTMDMQIIIEV